MCTSACSVWKHGQVQPNPSLPSLHRGGDTVQFKLTLIKVFLHLLCKTEHSIFHVLLRLTAIFQMMALLTPMDLKRLVCEGTDLDQYVYFGSQTEKEAFQNVSCTLSPQQLINSQQVLLQNLQPRKVLSEVRYPLLSHLVSK